MVRDVRSPAVLRAVAVLELTSREGPCTLAELTVRTGIARSTVVDLVGTMCDDRLLTREEDGRYALGRLLGRLMAGFTAGVPLAERFPSICDRVEELDGHTLTLETLDSARSLCIGVRYGRLPLPLTPRVGRRLLLTRSAGGRAILQRMTPEQWKRHLDEFRGFVPETHPVGLDAGAQDAMADESPDRGHELACIISTDSDVLTAVGAVVPQTLPDADHVIVARGVARLARLLARKVGQAGGDELAGPSR